MCKCLDFVCGTLVTELKEFMHISSIKQLLVKKNGGITENKKNNKMIFYLLHNNKTILAD